MLSNNRQVDNVILISCPFTPRTRQRLAMRRQGNISSPPPTAPETPKRRASAPSASADRMSLFQSPPPTERKQYDSTPAGSATDEVSKDKKPVDKNSLSRDMSDGSGASVTAIRRRARLLESTRDLLELLKLQGSEKASTGEVLSAMENVRDASVTANNESKHAGADAPKPEPGSPASNVQLYCTVLAVLCQTLDFSDSASKATRGTLEAALNKLSEAAQDAEDHFVFHDAVVEVVNQLLMFTPLKIPEWVCRDETLFPAMVPTSTGGERKALNPYSGVNSPDEAPALLDKCVDYLGLKDDMPVVFEEELGVWIDYVRAAYGMFVLENVTSEPNTPTTANAMAHSADTHARNPHFVPHRLESYFVSLFSQFAFMLLAAFYTRSGTSSTNYTARVNKIVTHFKLHRETSHEPIEVRQCPKPAVQRAAAADVPAPPAAQQAERNLGASAYPPPLHPSSYSRRRGSSSEPRASTTAQPRRSHTLSADAGEEPLHQVFHFLTPVRSRSSSVCGSVERGSHYNSVAREGARVHNSEPRSRSASQCNSIPRVSSQAGSVHSNNGGLPFSIIRHPDSRYSSVNTTFTDGGMNDPPDSLTRSTRKGGIPCKDTTNSRTHTSGRRVSLPG